VTAPYGYLRAEVSDEETGALMLNDEGSISILLAHPQSLFREAVRDVFDREPGLEVVADVATGIQAIVDADACRPDVAVLAMALRDQDAIETTRILKKRVPSCQVLVLTGDVDEDALVEVLEAGGSGYLTNESVVEDLIESVRAVSRGETLIPQDMVGSLIGRLMDHRRVQDEAHRRLGRLTPREREVLALLACGEGNDGIAGTLVISPQTARTHIQNVIGKLGVHSRLEAAMFVARYRLLDELTDVPRRRESRLNALSG
jgi:DNA-binding NarL/FixJ family response regulator